MSYLDDIVLGQRRNEENLDHAFTVFEDEGYDIDYTMNDAINNYRQTNNYNTALIADPREDMHDAMHIISNRRSGKVTDEAHVGIAEVVLLRGPYDTITSDDRNTANHERIERPISIPPFEQAVKLGRDRQSKINEHFGTSADVTTQELQETYNSMLKTDTFIRAVTNGRIVDDFSTNDTPDIHSTIGKMPLCLLGIIAKETADGTMEFEPIDNEQRQHLIECIQENPPHTTPVWDIESDARYGQALYHAPEI